MTLYLLLGMEFSVGRHLTLMYGLGAGFGADLGAASFFGGVALVRTGVYWQPFDDPRQRFKLEVRAITAVLDARGRVSSVIALSAALGFETTF